MTGSKVVGRERVVLALNAVSDETKDGLGKAFDAGIAIVKSNVLARVPVRRGRLKRALSSPDAVQKFSDGLGVQFGFLTAAQKKDAFHAPWVEYGTKGYQAGDDRASGVDKAGKPRFKKVKRAVPSRPANPFFRGGWDMSKDAARKLAADAASAALVKAAAKAKG